MTETNSTFGGSIRNLTEYADNFGKNNTVMENQGQEHDALLMLDEQKKKLSAVKGKTTAGDITTTPPDENNGGEFFRIDPNGDFFSNFFRNLKEQYKNPSRFKFFMVPVGMIPEVAGSINRYLKEGGNKLLKEASNYLVNINEKKEAKMDTQQNAQQQESEYKMNPDNVNWDYVKHFGITKERLQELNIFDDLFKGRRPPVMVPINIKTDGLNLQTTARMHLQKVGDEVVFWLTGRREYVNLSQKLYDYELTKEDRENLKNTGNLGRLVPIKFPNHPDPKLCFVSVDRMTNNLVTFPADGYTAPEKIGDTILTDHQKNLLETGRIAKIEMLDKEGIPYVLSLQFDADSLQLKKPAALNPVLNRVYEPVPQSQGVGQNSEQKSDYRIPFESKIKEGNGQTDKNTPAKDHGQRNAQGNKQAFDANKQSKTATGKGRKVNL